MTLSNATLCETMKAQFDGFDKFAMNGILSYYLSKSSDKASLKTSETS